MSKKYLDTVGLNKLVANILSKFAAKNHSHSNATTNSAGFMSSSDKVKLDGVAAGANKTIVDSSLNSTSTNAIQNKAVKTALDGKASSSHTHPTAQITGLDSKLSGFDSNIAELYRTKAKASHQHAAGDITSGVLAINRGGTGANNTMDAAYTLRVPRCHTGAKLVLIWGMTVVRLNGDGTQNIETFSSLTNKCGFSVGRYNCSIFFNTSDFAACPTIHAAYTSVDAIGIQATAGNQARVNYVIACWQ